MASLLRKIFGNASTRILAWIFLSLFSLALYFVFFGYNFYIEYSEENELDKLKAVANTATLTMNGNDLDDLFKYYPVKDAFVKENAPIAYQIQSQHLKAIKDINGIKTDVYTLHRTNNTLQFGVTSAANPYFKHNYAYPPELVLNNWNLGGIIPEYEDEHGIWLSAFAPILDANNNTVAVLMIDKNFSAFLSESRSKFMYFFLVILVFLILLGIFIYYQTKSILDEENLLKEELIENQELLTAINKETTDSIYYAKQIQNAVLPLPKDLDYCFDDSFVINMPLNIVGGDFWFHSRKNNETIVIMADCTGHGVPGAFMSLIGHSLLNEIVNQQGIVCPNKILKTLDSRIIDTLGARNDGSRLRDGMDVSVAAINKEKRIIKYAGAYRPLVLSCARSINFTIFKGERFSLGHSEEHRNKEFKVHEIKFRQNDRFYMFSDGVTDQFGGENGKKLQLKRFKTILSHNHDLSFSQQGKKIKKEIMNWMGETPQIDDILVLGFKLS